MYQYNTLGQVTSGKKYWSDGTPVAGAQYEYGFDTIGNRVDTKAGGDQGGLNLQTAVYTPDLLNRYSQRTVPGVAQVTGLADAGASVTVNSQAAYRRGDYFWKEVSVANAEAAVWQSLSVQAGGSTTTGHQFVPKAVELFSYDLDGNLTGDGRWNYTWDAENRLIRMIAATGVGPQQRLDFEYDAGGPRVRKTMWNNTAGSGPASLDVKFLYDGWNLLAELNALSGDAVLRSYVWGTDLSGSSQGAGGVGGLLKVTYYGTVTTNAFVAYDGNGNVMCLLDAATTTWVARYEYGPFGEVLRATGPMAKANPFRFSSKYQDDESELLYYGYRYYNPSTGRWLSRDPRGEEGGLNLCGFVKNCPVSLLDILGLGTWHIDFPENGTPDAWVDVYYALTRAELKCCSKATVDRYQVDVGMVTTTLDQDSGGYWDAITSTAHAEPDQPVGLGFRWPPWSNTGSVYRTGKIFVFKWKARCTEGLPDKILSVYEALITSPGHKEGSPFRYTTSPVHGL